MAQQIKSYVNILIFFLITLLYYFSLKPKATLENVDSPDLASGNNKATLIYFLLVILTQLFFNAYILSSTCQGPYTKYLGQAALYTLLPWTFFFGIVILVLYFAPSFKSAFSDVVGYYYVSSSANDILVTLLKNQGSPEIAQRVFEEGSGVDDSSAAAANNVTLNASPQDVSLNANIAKEIININNDVSKDSLNVGFSEKLKTLSKSLPSTEAAGFETTDEKSADLITKICGNVSVLINQMLPSNFNDYWNTLQPLFKPAYKNNETLKNKLFNLVVTRDNIGESMWFIYTGILVSSIIQFQLATFNCKA